MLPEALHLPQKRPRERRIFGCDAPYRPFRGDNLRYFGSALALTLLLVSLFTFTSTLPDEAEVSLADEPFAFTDLPLLLALASVEPLLEALAPFTGWTAGFVAEACEDCEDCEDCASGFGCSDCGG